jgi:hypothetical protein
MPNSKKVRSALKALEEEGLQVRVYEKYIRHTFLVKPATYQAFRALQGALGLKVIDAIDEALSDWIAKRRPRTAKGFR